MPVSKLRREGIVTEARRRQQREGPPCHNCGWTVRRYRWQVFRNGKRHIREECAACGAYLQFARQTANNVVRADMNESGTPVGG